MAHKNLSCSISCSWLFSKTKSISKSRVRWLSQLAVKENFTCETHHEDESKVYVGQSKVLEHSESSLRRSEYNLRSYERWVGKDRPSEGYEVTVARREVIIRNNIRYTDTRLYTKEEIIKEEKGSKGKITIPTITNQD